MYMLCLDTTSKIETGTENNTENVMMTLCKLMLDQHVECCVQYWKKWTRKAGEE